RIVLFAGLAEALALPLACRHYAIANLRGALSGSIAAQLLILHRGDLDMNVDAIEQRPGDFGDIALNHGRRAHALAGLVVEVSAWTWVHGRRQHKSRRESERHGGARDSDRVILERLAHHF